MPSIFETIPCEIRVHILRYCLHVEHGILDNPAASPTFQRLEDSNEQMPRVSLLQVSRQIFSEAAEILFGENEWHMFGRWPDASFNIPGLSFWRFYAPYFRHIVLHFEACRWDNYSAHRSEIWETTKYLYYTVKDKNGKRKLRDKLKGSHHEKCMIIQSMINCWKTHQL